jgi:hypothetical protein
VLRRYAPAGVTTLIGAGLQLGGWTAAGLAYILIGVGVLWTIWVLPPVADRRPKLVLERGYQVNNLALRVLPPPRSSKKKLRSETIDLVAKLHGYVRALPSKREISSEEADGAAAATTRAEKSAVWQKARAREREIDDAHRLEMADLFGGQVKYLVGEFQRRGMVTDQEATQLEWKLASPGWLSSGATDLEALARRL